ncbi:acetyl-CoA C-acyltransferase [Halobacteriovorax sp. HLS]|uniref:thiolase family protein n=1 Tax=Halobacteriovorax sp. HLS TaxID=2234000 RepID=UPI000FDA057B|nr:acetyl-CoA C-acyltransferase [Halobacteriovorax sp. HLS]
MKKTYLVYAKRTPMGKIGGSLSQVRVDDMLAGLFKDIKSWANFDLKEIDDVIVGCANQAGEDNRNLGRMAAVLAGFPYEVPATTINRLCGSSLDAVMDAVGRISAGFGDCFIIGGAESMTRAPLVISKGSTAFGRDSKMYDTTFGWRFPNPAMTELFPLYGMGETAEEVAEQYKISRVDQDNFALNSHKKACAAMENGAFDDEILPVEVKLRKSSHMVTTDEGPRASTNLEQLSKLRAVFRKDGTVTAGNASTMNDGASAVVVVSEEFLKKHNLTPIVEITGAAVRGVHPNVMGLGPIEATKKLCKDFNLKVSDFDIVELNEAFAAQALACMRELEIDESVVNLNGGAIALGHPLGCSGARILTTLAHQMKKNPKLKQGLATMCIGVGQGIALSVKRV